MVLILGAGINGCALARELILNGVSVDLVDREDIGYGATSRASRLIHGGLRYLEYGDIGLVRESLVERSRLLALAPHFVKPLPLAIPIGRRRGGMLSAATRFLRMDQTWIGRQITRRTNSARGLWVTRCGLAAYDFLSHGELGRHSTHTNGDANVPVVNRHYRFLCRFHDAQVLYPERFILALLRDAHDVAQETGVPFRVLPYHEVNRTGNKVIMKSCATGIDEALAPSAIVNTTGAWGDQTLSQLNVAHPKRFGGTKGSHFVTWRRELRDQLGETGIYAETPAGRMVFVLPFGEAVLVGTTDEPFNGDPGNVTASVGELDRLLELVNHVFPKVGLTINDVAAHYAGVRPLPQSNATAAGSIPRSHSIHVDECGTTPVLTLVGGKLSTCRAVAEQLTDQLLGILGRDRVATTRTRSLPGGADFPADGVEELKQCQRIAAKANLPPASVVRVWSFLGNRTEAVLRGASTSSLLTGTDIPHGFVEWVIENEWVSELEDLVERRLLLIFQKHMHRSTLVELAELLCQSGRLDRLRIPQVVDLMEHRLRTHYGRQLAPPESPQETLRLA